MTKEPLRAPAPPSDSTRRTTRTWLTAAAVFVLVGVLVVLLIGGLAASVEPDRPLSMQEVIDERREAVRESPGNPIVLLELAYAYQQAGRWTEALAAYDEVLDAVPVETGALYGRGVVLYELGDVEGAEEAWWGVLEINEAHALAARALGEHYALRGHYRSLLEAVAPAAEANESSADLQFLMGLAFENLDDPARAEQRYRRALEHYPDMPQARAGLERLGVTP